MNINFKITEEGKNQIVNYSIEDYQVGDYYYLEGSLDLMLGEVDIGKIRGFDSGGFLLFDFLMQFCYCLETLSSKCIGEVLIDDVNETNDDLIIKKTNSHLELKYIFNKLNNEKNRIPSIVSETISWEYFIKEFNTNLTEYREEILKLNPKFERLDCFKKIHIIKL